MTNYKCKCGREVKKSTNADNTGNRDVADCAGCPYLLPYGSTTWDAGQKRLDRDVRGYECRVSPRLCYHTQLGGSADDKCTMHISSLDFDFLECVSAWMKERYPDGEVSGGFNRSTMRACEFIDQGRYRMSISCAQSKKGIAAKGALLAAFFDAKTKTRLDIDAQAEQRLVLDAITRGKAGAQPLKEAEATMQIYETPGGELIRVSPEPDSEGYYYIERNSNPELDAQAFVREMPGCGSRYNIMETLVAQAGRGGWALLGTDKEKAALVPGCVCRGCKDADCAYSDCDSAAECDGHRDCAQSACSCDGKPSQGSVVTVSDAAAMQSNLPAFDYSELEAQTVATLKSAESMLQNARRNYVIQAADAIGMAHDELVRPSDKRNNQYSENTFVSWCNSVGVSRSTAYQLLQVANLIAKSTPNEQKLLEQAGPTLLYAVARPSAPEQLVNAVKSGDITTNAEYQRLLDELSQAQNALVLEQAAHEKAQSLVGGYRHTKDVALTNEKLREDERNKAREDLDEARRRVRELESRPIDVAVEQADPAEVERLAQEKAKEMLAALERPMPEFADPLDCMLMADNMAIAIEGYAAALIAVTYHLAYCDFSFCAKKLMAAAQKMTDALEARRKDCENG